MTHLYPWEEREILDRARENAMKRAFDFQPGAPVKVKIVIDSPGGKRTVVRAKKARVNLATEDQSFALTECGLPPWVPHRVAFAGMQFSGDGDDVIFTVERKKRKSKR